MKVILYTTHGGGVAIMTPNRECLRWMSAGGIWADMPAGFVDEQIDRQIAAGHSRHAAERYANAVAFGGHTEAEALEIIRDRDCAPFGTACELLDAAETQQDHWFRDAWRRSHNGGPIWIDMKAARTIQLRRIAEHAEKRKLELRMDRWRSLIRRAETPAELKQVWPRMPS